MPNRVTELFWVDILISIEKVKRYSYGFKDKQQLIENDLVYAATLRELEIIGEALKYILADPALSNQINLRWRDIVNFRNILAHEYFGIKMDAVFIIVSEKIFEFEFEFHEFISNNANATFFRAIKHTKKEVENNGWLQSVAYLDSIETMVRP
jgi:uncharacterized protein with HEPN domain